MKHNVSGRKLGRTSAHRRAMFRNQLASLVEHERITTTLAKAKELRPLAERMVTRGKEGSMHSRRLVARWISDRRLLRKLFDEISPRFQTRAGGYLRILKLGPRRGDGAEMAIVEFVEQGEGSSTPKSKAKAGKRRRKKKEEPEAGG